MTARAAARTFRAMMLLPKMRRMTPCCRRSPLRARCPRGFRLRPLFGVVKQLAIENAHDDVPLTSLVTGCGHPPRPTNAQPARRQRCSARLKKEASLVGAAMHKEACAPFSTHDCRSGIGPFLVSEINSTAALAHAVRTSLYFERLPLATLSWKRSIFKFRGHHFARCIYFGAPSGMGYSPQLCELQFLSHTQSNLRRASLLYPGIIASACL